MNKFSVIFSDFFSAVHIEFAKTFCWFDGCRRDSTGNSFELLIALNSEKFNQKFPSLSIKFTSIFSPFQNSTKKEGKAKIHLKNK
jgi:hypothetical protein